MTIPIVTTLSPILTNPNYQPLPGRLGNLTEVQLHTLDNLKEELKNEGHFVEHRMDDAMLLRWAF